MDNDDNDLAFKLEFAKVLLKQTDPFKAALQVFPTNTSRALRVANEWPSDPAVLAAQSELLQEDGELAFLPTKADFARELWSKMQSEKIDHDSYAKLGKLYAEIRGFIEKPQTNVNLNNNLINNRVMVVQQTGSDEEWERKLLLQQKTLTDESQN